MLKHDTAAPSGGLFADPRVETETRADGTIILRSGYALPEASRAVGDWIVHWAQETPDRVMLAERRGDGGWREVTYAAALDRIEALAGWLLESPADAEHPVAILSENSIDHALMMLAAMHVGIPAATISTAYSLLSSDHAKLKAMIGLLDPGVILVSDAERYAAALAAIEGCHGAGIVASEPGGSGALPFAEAAAANREAVGRAFAALTPDSIAKLLFTSGSTGTPKAVINTQRMLTSNQEAVRVIWPFLARRPPRIADWLPWSHTFGANFTANMVYRNGGSLYIDEGKPAPPLIGRTAANIKDVRPTMIFNVPRGYDMLLPLLEEDEDLRRSVFEMDLIFYAGAALPGSIWDRLIGMSRATTGRATPLVASWGSTETAPCATSCHFQAEVTGNIGVPVPGTELKLVPAMDKLEVRVKGPNITPGYFRAPELTADAFDEDGFYMIGDAVRLADPDDPAKGLFFDGRVSEDFKLTTGTWVSVGDIRIAGIDALAPVAQDIVVAGHDRAAVGFLIFPNEAACRKLTGAAAETPLCEVLADAALRAHVAQGLARLKRSGGGSSRHAARARFLLAPPDPDGGEITDKGYINQRQVLANRAAEVAALYANDPANIAPEA
mgnify:CR=1 FL=1